MIGIHTMIARYVEWLNANKGELDDFTFKPDDFFTYNPAKGLYGNVRLIVAYDTNWYHAVVISADYGDEGGPATLTAYFNRMVGPTDEIRYMTQEFDTTLTVIIPQED